MVTNILLTFSELMNKHHLPEIFFREENTFCNGKAGTFTWRNRRHDYPNGSRSFYVCALPILKNAESSPPLSPFANCVDDIKHGSFLGRRSHMTSAFKKDSV